MKNKRELKASFERCNGYCGVTCVHGQCSTTLNNKCNDLYGGYPSCNDCIYYKGCDDCYFKDTDMCVKGGAK